MTTRIVVRDHSVPGRPQVGDLITLRARVTELREERIDITTLAETPTKTIAGERTATLIIEEYHA